MGRRDEDIQYQFDQFLQSWDARQMTAFMRDIGPLFELFNIEEDEDWLADIITNKEEVDTIRLIRTVYLVSRIAEFHAGRLVSINVGFKGLWKKLEKIGMVEVENKKPT